MTNELDSMFDAADQMGEIGGGGDFFKPERAVLDSATGMMRVRFIGGWKKFFEGWCEQQPGPGIKQENIGRPRRIVSAGFKRDSATKQWTHDCPYSQKLWDMRDSSDPVRKQQGEDWGLTQFFAMHVVPLDMNTGNPDQWCVDNRHAKLLTTHRSTHGIKQTLFKSVAECLRVQRGYNPNLQLHDLDLIVTRTGSGLNTQYGCQVCPQQNNQVDASAFSVYDFGEFTTLTPLAIIQKFTGIDFGVSEGTPESVPSTPVAATPNPTPAGDPQGGVAVGASNVPQAASPAPVPSAQGSSTPAASGVDPNAANAGGNLEPTPF